MGGRVMQVTRGVSQWRGGGWVGGLRRLREVYPNGGAGVEGVGYAGYAGCIPHSPLQRWLGYTRKVRLTSGVGHPQAAGYSTRRVRIPQTVESQSSKVMCE